MVAEYELFQTDTYHIHEEKRKAIIRQPSILPATFGFC